MDAYSDSSLVSELDAFAAGDHEHKEDEAPWVDDGTLEALEAQGKSISSRSKAFEFKASFEPAAGGESNFSPKPARLAKATRREGVVA